MVFAALANVLGGSWDETPLAVAAPGPTLAERSAEAWRELRRSYDVQTLDELLKLPEPAIDLATAALLIERRHDADVDVAKLRGEVDRIAEGVLKDAGQERDPQSVVGVINDYIYWRRQIRPGAEGDEIPKQGRLSRVLTERIGNCLGLSTLFIAVGQRLGLPMWLIGVPNHVYVRLLGDNEDVDIECTAFGRRRGSDEWRQKVREGQPYPTVEGPRAVVAHLLSNEVGIHIREIGDLDCALADSNLMLSTHRSPGLFHNRGAVHFLRGSIPEAAADCRESIRLDPLDPDPHRLLAKCLHEMGELDAAVASLDRAIELDDTDAEARARRGLLRLILAADCNAIAEDLRRAIQIDEAAGDTSTEVTCTINGNFDHLTLHPTPAGLKVLISATEKGHATLHIEATARVLLSAFDSQANGPFVSFSNRMDSMDMSLCELIQTGGGAEVTESGERG